MGRRLQIAVHTKAVFDSSSSSESSASSESSVSSSSMSSTEANERRLPFQFEGLRLDEVSEWNAFMLDQDKIWPSPGVVGQPYWSVPRDKAKRWFVTKNHNAKDRVWADDQGRFVTELRPTDLNKHTMLTPWNGGGMYAVEQKLPINRSIAINYRFELMDGFDTAGGNPIPFQIWQSNSGPPPLYIQIRPDENSETGMSWVFTGRDPNGEVFQERQPFRGKGQHELGLVYRCAPNGEGRCLLIFDRRIVVNYRGPLGYVRSYRGIQHGGQVYVGVYAPSRPQQTKPLVLAFDRLTMDWLWTDRR